MEFKGFKHLKPLATNTVLGKQVLERVEKMKKKRLDKMVFLL
jgi:hypothetical protein